MVGKLIFLADVTRNAFLFTNITSNASIKKLCTLYKSFGIITYYSVSTLLGSCLITLPLTHAKSSKNCLYGSDVFYNDRKVGNEFIDPKISLDSCSEEWQTMPCSSSDF